MMKNIWRFFGLAILLGVSACSNDDADNEIVSVTVSADPDNALRYPVKVSTTDDCEVSITYWPKGDEGCRRTTRAVTTAGNVADVKVMFVKASTDYLFVVNIDGVRQNGEYSFHTSELPADVPEYHVAIDNGGAPAEGYMLQWQASKPGYITFCDMDANLVWYQQFEQAIRVANYNVDEQKLCVLTGFQDQENFQRLCDRIITLDLEGNYYVDWVASADNVRYPHHDIRFTPDGDLIMVNNVIKDFDLTELGLGADTEVWGDGFTIISTDGKVKRTWNNFDEYTPFDTDFLKLRPAVLKDFLHANSVNWDSEGNYYMTFNRINQLWKIDGATGRVLYRVGEHGNVKMDEADYPSGIHAAVPLAPNKVLVYDNGSARGYSRAMIYEIDPEANTATVTLKVDEAAEYSSTDRSNVQLLPDGKTLMFGNTVGRCNVFTDFEGNVLKVITRTGISYRSYYYPEL